MPRGLFVCLLLERGYAILKKNKCSAYWLGFILLSLEGGNLGPFLLEVSA